MAEKEIKDVLLQYRKILKMIRHLDEQIEEIEDKMKSIKARTISEMPRGSSGKSIPDFIEEKEELERRKEKFERLSKNTKDRVQEYIDTVISPRHNDILIMYYIKDMSIEEIAEHIHCSERHIWREYRKAMKMIKTDINL